MDREHLTHQVAAEILGECGFDVVKVFGELEERAKGKKEYELLLH